MNLDLIKVLGDDPFHEGHKTYIYLKTSVIYKIIPIYGEKGENGQYWSSIHDHSNSKIISYLLIDMNGDEYSCGNKIELQKIGIKNDDSKPKIGFLNQEGLDKLEIDIDNSET